MQWQIAKLNTDYTVNFRNGLKTMYVITLKNRFKNKRVPLKRSLEIVYSLPFGGFIQQERMKWWTPYIEHMTYQSILYPKQGYLVVIRLNHKSKEPNTIRVVTSKTSSEKRELFVLKSLFGTAKEIYEKKHRRYSDSKASVSDQKKNEKNINTNGKHNGGSIPTV